MKVRTRLLLFSVGAILGVWGTYAINHIDVILAGQRWSVVVLTGLVIWGASFNSWCASYGLRDC